MAIIALLAALFLPALTRARWAAIRVSCANNERQIGTALQLYLSDNGKYVCFQEAPPTTESQEDRTLNERTLYWDYRLLAYSLTTNTFFCPGKNAAASLTNWSCYDSAGQLMPNQSYGCNGTGSALDPFGVLEDSYNPFLGLGGARFSCLITESQIQVPADFICAADYDPYGTDDDNDSDRHPEMLFLGIIGRHRSSFNALFADGHLEVAKTNTFRSNADSDRRRWNRDDEPHPEF
jgi:prepilin-type processing-associated H-X9-DG protein